MSYKVKPRKRKLTRFQAWIEEMGGCAGLGLILGVHRITVYHWMAGNAIPHSTKFPRLLALGKGKITIDDLINPKPLERKYPKKEKAK